MTYARTILLYYSETQRAFTPHQYVNHRRVAQAQRLFADPNLTLAEISYRCGFSGQSQFTAIFRRFVGVTPGKFRFFLVSSVSSGEIWHGGVIKDRTPTKRRLPNISEALRSLPPAPQPVMRVTGDEAMHTLKLTLYKVRLLNPAADDIVVRRWNQDKILSIAVRESWPENYYEKLTTRRNPRPMDALVGPAMNVQVDRRTGDCKSLVGPNGQRFTKCDWRSNPVFGDPVWRLLKYKAAPLGVLGAPQWPAGAQL